MSSLFKTRKAGKNLSRLFLTIIVVLAISFGLIVWKKADPPVSTQHKEWKDYGGGPDNSKFVDLKQFTKSNVNQLEVAFVYPTNDNVGYKFNPIVVDNVMYVLAKNNSLVAVDATTGKEKWIHANLRGIIQRGINFWQSKDKKQKRLIIFLNNTMQAIDANTGKSIMNFGTNGYTDMRLGLDRDPATIGRGTSTTPGHIFENLIIVGSAPGENPFSGPGHLRAYSVLTGKLVWKFHTIPHPGEYGYDTWPKEAYKYVGGTNTWGEISVDEQRGIAYFPLGSPTYDYDGADRHGSNLFGNCILALNARTGKRIWHFQTVHHDLWDYDLTTAPQLITVIHNGKKVDAIAQPSKNGFLFVLDRVTGKPLWPIEERPVPKSEMPDEEAWPTQPFVTVVPPFNRQIVTVDDLNPYFTPEEKEKWTKRIQAAKAGFYVPLSDKYETITMPGAVGGANYGNSASDPDKGIVYIQTQELPDFYSLKLRSASGQRGGGGFSADRMERAQKVYTQYCQTCHGANKTGVTGLGSDLSNLATRINAEDFKAIIKSGKGRMAPLPHVEDAQIADLYAFLVPRGGRGGQQNEGNSTMPEGPVVASGGVKVAPAGPTKRLDYPEGYKGPKALYIEANNWGVGVPNLLTPPWSLIVAYDLNKGTIKWKIPLGNDDKIPGSKNLSIPGGSQGKGMVVTSSGLLFATAADGRIYAYDAEDGKILWTGELGRNNPGGIPAMYEAGGRQYLVVCSTGGLKDKTKNESDVPKGYVVYALPKKK